MSDCLQHIEQDFLAMCSIHGDPLTPDTTDCAMTDTLCYYYGLPSRPILVYRTGNPWKEPTGPEAYLIPKEARPVFNHPIVDTWDELGPQVPRYLDSVNIMWTSIDVVRFAEVEEDPGPPVLWIGVKPGSLSHKDAEDAACGCVALLSKFELTDIEVAFRESVFTRSAGHKLLEHVCFLDATADLRGPLTPLLGLKIAGQTTPDVEGTGALYIRESSNSAAKVFILTARHVVFPPNTVPNEPYDINNIGGHRCNVHLLGRNSFQGLLESIMTSIRMHTASVSHYNDNLKELMAASGDDEHVIAQAKEQTKVEHLLQKEEAVINTLNKFYSEVTRYWSPESLRILGHVTYSPPISVQGTSTKYFTEDWALIELDGEKIDWKTFRGNVIDLSTFKSDSLAKPSLVPMGEFTTKIKPKFPTVDSKDSEYFYDRLFPLQSIVKSNEFRYPITVDKNGEWCRFVIKNGAKTGVTIGRASGMMSFVREYLQNGSCMTFMQLAIYPCSHKDDAFSAPGDSGSIIVDSMGGIIGLLTGGSGQADSIDVTYATPFCWLWDECIKKQFPDASLY